MFLIIHKQTSWLMRSIHPSVSSKGGNANYKIKLALVSLITWHGFILMCIVHSPWTWSTALDWLWLIGSPTSVAWSAIWDESKWMQHFASLLGWRFCIQRTNIIRETTELDLKISPLSTLILHMVYAFWWYTHNECISLRD